MFDIVEDSVVVLFDIVDELVSLLVAGALVLFDMVSLLVAGVLVCALVLGYWVLESVLVPDVCAMDMPPAMAAATARVVSVFRVAFISYSLSSCLWGTWQLEENRRRVPAGFQIRTAPSQG